MKVRGLVVTLHRVSPHSEDDSLTAGQAGRLRHRHRPRTLELGLRARLHLELIDCVIIYSFLYLNWENYRIREVSLQ